MWKIIPFLLLFAAPVKADITHKLTSSVQLQVNAAATNVERIGTSYSVSGNNVTTQYTPDGGSATNSVGSLTVASGVGSIPTLSAVQATAGESFSFTQSFTQGDAIVSSAPTVRCCESIIQSNLNFSRHCRFISRYNRFKFNNYTNRWRCRNKCNRSICK